MTGKDVNTSVTVDELAFARSGDKGDTVNIGVIAYDKPAYQRLKKQLTTDRVAKYFGDHFAGPVDRYELPNIYALNFHVSAALDGGGAESLRIDSQGKTYAAALLQMELPVWEDDTIDK